MPVIDGLIVVTGLAFNIVVASCPEIFNRHISEMIWKLVLLSGSPLEIEQFGLTFVCDSYPAGASQ